MATASQLGFEGSKVCQRDCHQGRRGRRDGKFKGEEIGLAGEDTSAMKEAVTGVAKEVDLLGKELVEVIGEHGQAQDGLGGKKLVAAKAGQAEPIFEFLDDIFHLGATVIVAPDIDGVDLIAEVGEQGLVLVTGTIEEPLAAPATGGIKAPAQDHHAPGREA